MPKKRLGGINHLVHTMVYEGKGVTRMMNRKIIESGSKKSRHYMNTKFTIRVFLMEMSDIYLNTSSSMMMTYQMNGLIQLGQQNQPQEHQNQKLTSKPIHITKITKQFEINIVNLYASLLKEPIQSDKFKVFIYKNEANFMQKRKAINMQRTGLQLLFLGLMIISPQWIFGQIKQPRIVVGIVSGIGYPKDKFASTELFDEKSGFAKEGLFVGIDASYQLEKNYGICGAVRIGSHAVDVKSLANGYASVLGGIFRVSAQRWVHSDIFGGAFISIPINRLNIGLRMMPGLVNFSYPEITAESDQYVINQQSLPSKVIGFCAGGSVRYKISETFSAAMQAEIMRAKPSFQVDYRVNGLQEVVTVDQPVSIHQLGLSIYYNIY